MDDFMRQSAALLTLIGLLLGGCSNGSDKPLSIAINDWTGYQPLVLAQEQGQLDPRQVHLATLGSATDSLRQFRAGTVDAVTVTLDEALLLRAEGFDITAILVMDISMGADAIVAQPRYKTMASLHGRRIGYENSAVGAYMLARALALHHIPLQEVQLVPVTADRHLNTFKLDEVDALVTFEPIKSQLTQTGGRVVFDSSEIPDEVIDLLVVRSDCLGERSAQIQQVVDAWFSTLDYMRLHPQEGVDWLSRHQSSNHEAIQQALNGMKFPSREENRLLITNFGSGAADHARQMGEVMLKAGLLPRLPPLDRLFNARYL